MNTLSDLGDPYSLVRIVPSPAAGGRVRPHDDGDSLFDISRTSAGRIPLGRRGRPDEVALWVLRLADPAATWLTGQILTIDGGLELV
ncbi:SDR family oxidoreductase [Streptosporangium subroseum]|uniref:SDR family oxidoreductase n=1 Tax=Streptosporangium subroseum TaxID=106412 RepID=UPI003F4D76CF